MISKNQVARRFGKMSHSYDEYAKVQKSMAVTLQQLAKTTVRPLKILEIGCGTGYLTRLIAGLFPQASILATDIAPGMLSAARSNLRDFPNIHYALEDGENLRTTDTFDLIISNAVFQWFNDYPGAYRSFFDHLRPGGYLLYATFGPHTFRELHASFQAAAEILGLDAGSRHGQSFPASADLHMLMTGLGYTEVFHREEYFREYFPAVKDFLTSIKKIGANNASHHGNYVINRQLFFAMMRFYEKNYQEKAQIYATYHAIYGCGRK